MAELIKRKIIYGIHGVNRELNSTSYGKDVIRSQGSKDQDITDKSIVTNSHIIDTNRTLNSVAKNHDVTNHRINHKVNYETNYGVINQSQSNQGGDNKKKDVPVEENHGATQNSINDRGDLWAKVLTDLEEYYGEALYKSWFSKIVFSNFSNEKNVMLFAPSNFIRDWIKSNYLSVVLEYLKRRDRRIESVEIVTNSEACVDSNFNVQIASSEVDNSFDEEFYLSLDGRSTFENFVVGTPNELAYAASYAVADSRSAILESNPLFLYGGVGLGKTHLMHAIAWHVRKNNPSRRVLYISAEKFMYTFIKALRNKDVMMFKEKFRNVDILMIDDIQFICGKDSTQEEFFHTFNAIIDNNRQMVISCDRSPADLDNVEDRIKSRLGWGLVADVHSTTYELRLGILQSKVEQLNTIVPVGVLEFLADKITSNVRELEGALNKVIAHARLVNKEITIPTTQYILKDLLKSNEKSINIDIIQKKVAEYYKIKMSDMFSSKRNRVFARPRQVAMYMSKNLTSKSLIEIGSKFGNKDHTTVMHAIKTIERLTAEDSDFRDEVDLLLRMLQ